jgi:hypothetical protein
MYFHDKRHAVYNLTNEMEQLRPQPNRRERVIDPHKEWEKVRDAWNNDVAAWERYSGFRLSTT